MHLTIENSAQSVSRLHVLLPYSGSYSGKKQEVTLALSIATPYKGELSKEVRRGGPSVCLSK